MKTIEKAAKEFEFQHGEQLFNDLGKSCPKLCIESFKEGAKFITKWYTFDEELPEHNVKVETKDIHGEIITFQFTGSCNIKDSAIAMSFTHWRPIYNLALVSQK